MFAAEAQAEAKPHRHRFERTETWRDIQRGNLRLKQPLYKCACGEEEWR